MSINSSFPRDAIKGDLVFDPVQLPCGCFLSESRTKKYIFVYSNAPHHLCGNSSSYALPDLVYALDYPDIYQRKRIKEALGEQEFAMLLKQTSETEYPAPLEDPVVKIKEQKSPCYTFAVATFITASVALGYFWTISRI